MQVRLCYTWPRMKGTGVRNTSQEASEASTGRKAGNRLVGSYFKVQ